jgi:hypothetical protein
MDGGPTGGAGWRSRACKFSVYVLSLYTLANNVPETTEAAAACVAVPHSAGYYTPVVSGIQSDEAMQHCPTQCVLNDTTLRKVVGYATQKPTNGTIKHGIQLAVGHKRYIYLSMTSSLFKTDLAPCQSSLFGESCALEKYVFCQR